MLNSPVLPSGFFSSQSTAQKFLYDNRHSRYNMSCKRWTCFSDIPSHGHLASSASCRHTSFFSIPSGLGVNDSCWNPVHSSQYLEAYWLWEAAAAPPEVQCRDPASEWAEGGVPSLEGRR